MKHPVVAGSVYALSLPTRDSTVYQMGMIGFGPGEMGRKTARHLVLQRI